MNRNPLQALARRLETAKSDAWRLWVIYRQSRSDADLEAYVIALRRCHRLQGALAWECRLSPDVFSGSVWNAVRSCNRMFAPSVPMVIPIAA